MLMPGCWLGAITVHSDHHLFFVVSGRARVLSGDERHDLAAQEALWIPPGVPVDQITTEPGTVALSALLPVASFPDAPAVIVHRRISDTVLDVLLHLHSHWITPFWTTDGVTGDIAATLRQCFLEGNEPLVPRPTIPRSPAARTVALRVVEDPADRTSILGFAEETAASARNLTRMFRDETGLPFTTWRLRLRMSVAERSLADGVPVAVVADRFGYADASSFSRAFRKESGVAPGAVRTRARDRGDTGDRRGPEGAGTGGSGVPLVPAARMEPVVGAHSVLIWMVRGTCRVDLPDSVLNVAEGEAVWLPAGVRHDVATRPGAVLLPVGSVPASVPVYLRDAVPFVPRTVTSAEMLYRASVVNTRLRPYPTPRSVRSCCTDLLPATVTSRTPDAWDALTAAIITGGIGGAGGTTGGAAEKVTDAGIGWWCRRFRVSPEQLDDRFRRRTGQSYTDWLSARRMVVARLRLKNSTASVATLAREVGFSASPAFVRAFRAQHGMTPGEFRRRYLRHVVFDLVE